MPRRDGTGPMGHGAMTGGRFGTCVTKEKVTTVDDKVFGLGFARRRGLNGSGRGMAGAGCERRGFFKK